MNTKKTSVVILIVAILLVTSIFLWQNRVSKTSQSAEMKANSTVKNAKTTQTASDVKEQASVEISSLFFDPKSQSTGANENFSMNAMIDPKGKKVSAAELHIVFDPKKLNLKNVNPSDTFSLVLMGSQIDNEKGTASIVLGVPLGKPAVDKNAQIATLDFQALSSGNTEVSFTDKSVAAAEGASTNVVAQRVTGVVMIK